MPSLRSQTRARATTARSRSLARRSTGIKLVPADPEEYESSVRNFISDDADYARPEGLEEPWPYVFQVSTQPEAQMAESLTALHRTAWRQRVDKAVW